MQVKLLRTSNLYMSPITRVNCFFNVISTPVIHDAIVQIPYKSIYTGHYVDMFGLCM